MTSFTACLTDAASAPGLVQLSADKLIVATHKLHMPQLQMHFGSMHGFLVNLVTIPGLEQLPAPRMTTGHFSGAMQAMSVNLVRDVAVPVLRA